MRRTDAFSMEAFGSEPSEPPSLEPPAQRRRLVLEPAQEPAAGPATTTPTAAGLGLLALMAGGNAQNAATGAEPAAAGETGGRGGPAPAAQARPLVPQVMPMGVQQRHPAELSMWSVPPDSHGSHSSGSQLGPQLSAAQQLLGPHGGRAGMPGGNGMGVPFARCARCSIPPYLRLNKHSAL